MNHSLTSYWQRYRREWILGILALITFIIASIPPLVESWYSNGVYPYIGRFFRFIFGWIPFSFGDILYAVIFLLLMYKLWQFIKQWRSRQLPPFFLKQFGRKLLRIVLIVYLLFQWGWGLNYHRQGSAYQLNIEPDKYTLNELQQLTDTLNSRLFTVIAEMQSTDSLVWKDFAGMRSTCIAAYQQAAKQYPFTAYNVPSVKKMLISSMGGYGGYNGYLNPFTGEAQVDADLPAFLLPFVICHEMAHQVGYAAEEEANMIGYLAGRSSSNAAIRYSVYHDLMWYASRELLYIDSMQYQQLVQSWPPLVKQHQLQAKAYFKKFSNPVQLWLNRWYDLYLKANSQEKGMRSYSYVTAWLIAYASKYGWEKI